MANENITQLKLPDTLTTLGQKVGQKLGQKLTGRPRQGIKLVKKSGTPAWQIQFYDEASGATRRVSTGTTDRQEAVRFLAKWQLDKEEKSVRPAAKVVANQYVVRPAQRTQPRLNPLPNPDAFNRDFFARVRTLRVAAGLSQAEAAAALGCSVQAYTHWEKHSPMPLRIVPAFVRLVGTDYHFLLTGETR